jgi:hypothetical protein
MSAEGSQRRDGFSSFAATAKMVFATYIDVRGGVRLVAIEPSYRSSHERSML